MSSLSEMKCVPCSGEEPKLTTEEIAELIPSLPGWRMVKHEGIVRLFHSYKFKDFGEALAFTNRVAEIAEEEDHHPMLVTEWGKVTVSWWTHKIGGLHQNDFIMAAKTDGLYAELE